MAETVFANAVVVRRAIAEQHDLHTISDVARVAGRLVFGGPGQLADGVVNAANVIGGKSSPARPCVCGYVVGHLVDSEKKFPLSCGV